jgi:multidrug resistance efflux pump
MLLPQEYINDSAESYFYKNRIPSLVIYWTFLVVVVVVLILLPFIYIDISLSSSGFVRPKSEITTLISPVSEVVEKTYFNEGDEIHKGDVLLTFRTEKSDYKIHYDKSILSDHANHIRDLQILTMGQSPSRFATQTRQKEYVSYQAKVSEISTYIQQTEIEYKRNKILFDEGLISQEEYEKYYYAYKNRVDELTSLKQSQLTTWQSDLNNYMNQYSEYQSDFKQQTKDKSLHVITSPVDGTLEQFHGIYAGSPLQEGTSIAVISPHAELLAECYVKPNDIGFIHPGMNVNLQVATFNYNEWGVLRGVVEHVSSDYIQDEQNNTFFKVRCQIETPYLVYKKTSRKGYIKKGMNVTAHFIITRRSLFDLLYQNIDEWINPAQNEK